MKTTINDVLFQKSGMDRPKIEKPIRQPGAHPGEGINDND